MSNVNIVSIQTVRGEVHVTFNLRKAGMNFVAQVSNLDGLRPYVRLDARLNQNNRHRLDGKFWLAQPEVKTHVASAGHIAAVAAHADREEWLRATSQANYARIEKMMAADKVRELVMAKAARLAGQARREFPSPEREALRVFTANGLEAWRHQAALEKLTATLAR